MSSQRERQEKRERERSQRQLTAPALQNTSNTSLFGEPIRKSNDDETTKRIKSTLGDFDSVQLLLINDPKPLLGISTREITRIKGHKAKIEQILSEMKHTLEPITGLDDYNDDINTKYSSNSFNNANNSTVNNSQHFVANNNTNNNNNSNNNNCNDIQKSVQMMDKNNRKSNTEDIEMNDTNSDAMSGRSFDGQKSFTTNNKVMNCKKRKLSKSEAENGSKSTKRTRSTSSSENSSDSSSNSSSISSSSSESSDEEEEGEEGKGSEKECVKQEDIPPPRQETPKTAPISNQPEIDAWDLETFMDKQTTTTTTTSSTTLSTNATLKSSSYDSMTDVIDSVAKGELGESMSSDSSSCGSLSPPTPAPIKRPPKWMQTIEKDMNEKYDKREEKSSQNSLNKHTSHPTPKLMTTPKKSIPQTNTSQTLVNNKSPQKRLKDDNKYDKMTDFAEKFAPKSLIVSIKLTLLNRIPGQTYLESSGSSGSNFSLNSDCLDTIDTKSAKEEININDNNNRNSFSKTKNADKNNLTKIKPTNDLTKESTNKKDSKSKSSNKSSSKKGPKSPPMPEKFTIQDDSHSSEQLQWSTTPPMRDHSFANTSSFSHSVKHETHSPTPPQLLPPLTNSSLLPIPPALKTTAAPSITQTSTRTPVEISPNVGQPDDFLLSAKRLKHAADRETDRTVQACKYLEAVLFFILTGNAMEQKNPTNEAEKVSLMYKETLNLIRTITNKFSKSRSPHSADVPTTDHKLTTLSYRCQSLLYLKLSRIKSKEIRDNNKMISNQTQEINNSDNCVSIPTSLLTALQRQLFLLQQYHTAHDLWSQADHLIEKHPSCKAFFVALDNECGSLSLNSSFDHLVHYVRTGLQILK